MSASGTGGDSRIAVLVDCDNTNPEILEFALRVVAQFGRVVVRRGYGNHSTLAKVWQEALVGLAFTPCLQYQYASGKNTADIALALDALEAMFDQRADTFCLVTSDSDFAYLCRKLRERGATVFIVGEAKSPEALRNASDQFFEWVPPPKLGPVTEAVPGGAPAAIVVKADAQKKDDAKPLPMGKQRPKFVVEAVALLTGDTVEGKVALSPLGSYLRRSYPSFSPQVYGHSGLLDMLRCYDLLALEQEPNGHWTVKVAARKEAV